MQNKLSGIVGGSLSHNVKSKQFCVLEFFFFILFCFCLIGPLYICYGFWSWDFMGFLCVQVRVFLHLKKIQWENGKKEERLNLWAHSSFQNIRTDQ